MKKLLIILLVLQAQFIYSQFPCEYYCLTFEETRCMEHLVIDTIEYPQTIWQIGKPQKPGFDQAVSLPNALVTDTLLPYPVSNYSAFLIRDLVDMGDYYGISMFEGTYRVQSDSLNDYGMIEFSPDMGATWVDMINDAEYAATFVWFSPKPVLTGDSKGWKFFDLLMNDVGSTFGLQLGDTILMRFSFTSDTVAENLGGLMYDNLCFGYFIEGISETRFKSIKSKIFPNPSSNNYFTVKFDNPDAENYQLSIYTIQSKLVFSEENIIEGSVMVDANAFSPGIYIYKLTNLKAKKRSWGKFIVTE